MTTIDNEGIISTPVDRCPWCGSAGQIVHAGLRDETFGAPGDWSLRRCPAPACGLAWIDPKPLESELIKLYATYYTHGEQPGDGAAAVDDARPPPPAQYASTGYKRRIKRVLRAVLPWWRNRFDGDFRYAGDRPPGRALEIGCGPGTYLAALKAAGWDAVGIDFDEKAVAEARRHGVDARVADLSGSAFEDGSFDLIAMFDVIEHLFDPVATVAECHRLLRPGGRLVMATPNIDADGHRLFGRDWRGLEPPRHLHIFSVATLADCARRGGFTRVDAFPLIKNAVGARHMVEQSQAIARARGGHAPDQDPDALDRRASRQSWLGASNTEWIVLVADRT